MRRQAPRSVMSMGMGVVAGSMLVPELPCCWMVWMSVCADITIGAFADMGGCVFSRVLVWARAMATESNRRSVGTRFSIGVYETRVGKRMAQSLLRRAWGAGAGSLS